MTKCLSVRRPPPKKRIRTRAQIPRESQSRIPSGSRFTTCPFCSKSVATSLLDCHVQSCLVPTQSKQATIDRGFMEATNLVATEATDSVVTETKQKSHEETGSKRGHSWQDSATDLPAKISNESHKQSQVPKISDRISAEVEQQSQGRCNEKREGNEIVEVTEYIHRTESDSGDGNDDTVNISKVWSGKYLGDQTKTNRKQEFLIKKKSNGKTTIE